MRAILLCLLIGCATRAAAPASMQLRRVTLYQNGLGYFERTGHVTGEAMTLRFSRGELDDVLKTLTVIDRAGASVATVDVPTPAADAKTIDLGVRLAAGRVHDVAVSYATPTPTWRAAYRVVLDEHARDHSLLQAWAMINNVSQDDWAGVQLTLATGAPMSFALDMHTPQFVSRPDATARLAPPNAIAPIDAERARTPDNDRDGILDDVDGCPDEPGPAARRGRDGCPDRGRIIVTNGSVRVLEPVRFAKDSDVLAPEAAALLDAVADTLAQNLDLTRVEIDASASADEADPWGLSLRRATAVRAALIARGIDASRLAAVPIGATQPLGDVVRSRRADFVIAQRAPDAGALDPATVAASAHTRTTPSDVAGAVRYALGEPVSIRRGASAMLSILNHPVTAEDAFLWRPDNGAPGSDHHPFRAVRLANTSGFTLQPGPIAVFARGTFVGDGLIGSLSVGDTAWVPYALDGGTSVTVVSTSADQPVRVAAVHHGVMTVDVAGVRTTTYTIAAGHEPAAAIYLHHAKAAGFTARDLPPGTLDEGDAYLIKLPLSADRTTTLAIEERQPRQRSVRLLDTPARELGAYVDAGPIAPELADKLRVAIDLRTQLGTTEEAVAALRERVADAAARAEDLRASLHALDHVSAADALRRKLVASLAAATGDAEALARQLGERTAAVAAARAALSDAVRDLASD